MLKKEPENRKKRVLLAIYSSSMGISMTALAVVAILEVAMLIYSTVNPALYGPFIWKYRAYYIALLAVAIVYILLNLIIKRDFEHRYAWLNVANPLCAIFFFAWAIGITWSDAMGYGTVDATVFMTFSLIVPLSFYLFPAAYAAIVLVADAVMMYLTVEISSSAAPLINSLIFFIFQIVLGISFLRLKVKLAERIVEEEENADIDVMTGFPNRRVYEEDIRLLNAQPPEEDLVYIAIDLNGLKEINDDHGHATGDRMIVGASECIEACFGARGRMYRIGGDEFAVLLSAEQEELETLLGAFEAGMREWSSGNGVTLSASYGCARSSEHPDTDFAGLARAADDRMYEAKADYYQTSGRDRRRFRWSAVRQADDLQDA